MALLIRDGRIITPTEDFTGDIYAEHETITRIEPHIDAKLVAPGAEIVEARGKCVFPGFIDPHVLLKIQNLELTARTVVEGFVQGLHKSPYTGFSVDFAAYRQYMPGDEIRRIDWKAMARRGKPITREFETERSQNVVCMLDVGRLMRSPVQDASGQLLAKVDYDLVQTALTKVFLAWQRLGEIEAPEPYARKVLVNTATSWWRRRWHGERPTPTLPERPARDGTLDFDERDLLWRHVTRLPARQRAVLVLRFYEDLSEAETARLLGVSTGTVKSQSSRALATLRQRLAEAGIEPAASPVRPVTPAPLSTPPPPPPPRPGHAGAGPGADGAELSEVTT